MDLTRVNAKDMHRNASTLLRRVRRGERFIIEWYEEDTALLLPASDLERLEEKVSQEQATYNTEQPAPEEADRLVSLFAPKLALQVMEQCWQDKSTARRVLLQALLKLEEGQP